ncbi:MAG: TetR/AcrR family transcriptional regulator [Corynebacterium glucuronolyticum]|nr:TetR/AcrR family transcriptional regulator [Corynebacterium glucuronolyticum]MDD7585675.1 TetR/AcrR family transcriptional regulator [Mycobacteriaceae bacterium]MDY5835423.1 TetR/AcrR family transcriptional regulator [Corynebacterium glucuronolyticum]
MSTRTETIKRLREATRRIIIRKGIGGCRIDRITTEAGLSRGAFYSNFSSLDELLSSTLTEHLTGLTKRALALDDRWSDSITRFTPEYSSLSDGDKLSTLLRNAAVASGLDADAEIINLEMIAAVTRGQFSDLPLDALEEALYHVATVVLCAVGRVPASPDAPLGLALLKLAPRDEVTTRLATIALTSLSRPA